MRTHLQILNTSAAFLLSVSSVQPEWLSDAEVATVTGMADHMVSRQLVQPVGPRILKPGTNPKDQLTLYREMSPVQYLSPTNPPLLMIQGDKDTTIPVKHALHMQEQAKIAKSPVEVIIVKNAGHNWREAGGTIDPGIDQIVTSTVKFLTERLKAVRL